MKPFYNLSLFENQTGKQLCRNPDGLLIYTTDSPGMRVNGYSPSLNLPLYCRMFCRSNLQQRMYQSRIQQSFLSVEYIHSGAIYIRNGKNAYIAEPGDLCFLQPGNDNDMLFFPEPENCCCEKWGMIIEGPLLPSITEYLRLGALQVVHFEKRQIIETLLEQIDSTLAGLQNNPRPEQLTGQTLELLTVAARHAKYPSASPEIVQLRTFIDAHFTEKLHSCDFTERLKLSQPTLNRLFREATGQTIHQYILERRLEFARHLLVQTTMRIKEIAENAGFSNPFHFSSLFQKTHHCSPSVYRNTNSTLRYRK